jgi:hypothetical protein
MLRMQYAGSQGQMPAVGDATQKHVPPSSTREVLHTPPAHEGCPAAPHGAQVPFTLTVPVEQQMPLSTT